MLPSDEPELLPPDAAAVANPDGPPDARLCSVRGNEEVNCDSSCTDVPAGVRAAWATAAA